MKKMSETIVFFGSGPVAAKSLELLAQDFNIEGVVTKPKPPHHKGDFPVIAVAEKLKLSLYTVTDNKDLSKLVAKKPFKSRVGVLIDFGIIVGQDVIDYFPLGIINSHFSLLPEWRGADPITFALLSGQKQTGVSLMLLVEKMDEGPLLSLSITEDSIIQTMNIHELTDYLINTSDALLKVAIPDYIKGKIIPRSQDEVVRMMQLPGKVTYSRKLTKQDGIIDWGKPAEQLEREVRAFLGWPGSITTLASKDVTITKAHVAKADGKPSSINILQKELIVYCGEQALVIDSLKPAGGKEMSGWSFVAGHKELLK